MTVNFNPTTLLEDGIERSGCRGGLCAIAENETIATFYAGSISEHDRERQFYIWSISKTFTAAAILLLCEREGDFLDEPFLSFFPCAPIPADITIRQLLNHTSGLSDYFSTKEYQDAVHSHPEAPWSYEEIMKSGLRGTPVFKAGNGWLYSNTAYAFLKELIERISGDDYYRFLEFSIIKPLGLLRTEAFLRPDFELKLLEGDEPRINGDFRPRYAPGWIATGCLISTVGDVARFFRALFSGELVSDESLKEMKRTVDVPLQAPSPGVPAYGLGLMHSRKDHLGDAYGHGGGGPGYTTYARHYPDLEGGSFTISLVLNRTIMTPFDLADDITRAFIKARREVEPK